jgi:hypothetical protein
LKLSTERSSRPGASRFGLAAYAGLGRVVELAVEVEHRGLGFVGEEMAARLVVADAILVVRLLDEPVQDRDL